MIIIEICVVILTIVYVTRTLIELSLILKIRKKIVSILTSLDSVSDNIQALSSDIKDEGKHIKGVVHGLTEETRIRVQFLRESLDRINESLYMFSSIVRNIADIAQGFFKKDSKVNNKMGDDSL